MPLLAIVFSVQLIGAAFEKRLLKSALAVGLLSSGTICLQNALGILIMLALVALGISHAPIGMGHMPFTGFYGGHGLPAIAANIFDNLGYWDADIVVSVGTTYATVGLLFGIIAGIVTINIAARKNLIGSDAGLKSLDAEELSGYVPPQKRGNVVQAIASHGAINPVAFHMAIILSILFFAYALGTLPFFSSFPVTVNSLFVGILCALLGRYTPLGNYLDRASLLHVSGASLEFLIVSSIALTNLSVFSDYALEMLLLSVCTACGTLAYVFFFGHRIQRLLLHGSFFRRDQGQQGKIGDPSASH